MKTHNYRTLSHEARSEKWYIDIDFLSVDAYNVSCHILTLFRFICFIECNCVAIREADLVSLQSCIPQWAPEVKMRTKCWVSSKWKSQPVGKVSSFKFYHIFGLTEGTFFLTFVSHFSYACLSCML
jgi:hypothetical protein